MTSMDSNDPPDPDNREILCEGRFVRLVRQGHWEHAERTRATGAVIVLAVTDAGALLLTEQLRIPLGVAAIELPAGLVGDEAGRAEESTAEAAHRELLEETGYAAERIEPLTAGPTSGGLSDEIVQLVRAHGLRRVHAGGGDNSERIVVHEVPLAECHDWLERQRAAGKAVDPKVYAALYWLGSAAPHG